MKILLVPAIYLPSIGGVELNTHQLALHLTRMGHDIIVLTSTSSKWQLFRYEHIDGISVFRLPFHVFRGSLKSLILCLISFPIAFVGTFLLIIKYRPDLVNVHFTNANAFYILLSRYLIRFPLIVSFHGNEVITVSDPSELGYTRTQTKWLRWTISRLLKCANYITANSQKLIDQAGMVDDQVIAKSRRIIYAVDRDENVGTVATTRFRPYILAVGRLCRQKGFDLLIEAFAGLSAHDLGRSLIVIGDGPERETLAKRIHEHNLENRIILTGALPRERVASYYKNSLFLVAPSRWEGLPTTILESFSYGKPVIATAVDGIPEAVKDGFNGLLVSSENIQELGAAMDKLLKDADLRAELTANARTFMDEIGDWDKVAQRYCEVYQFVIRGKG